MGPGWDFWFYGHWFDEKDAAAYRTGALLASEGAPIPLERTEDYTGIQLKLEDAAYLESGVTWFALRTQRDNFETWNVELRFVQRQGNWYRVEFKALFNATNEGESLELSAWAEHLPDRAVSKQYIGYYYPSWGSLPEDTSVGK